MPTYATKALYPFAYYQDVRDTRLPATVIKESHGSTTLSGAPDDTWTGTKNPGWRDKIAKRINASSAYSRTKFNFKQGVCFSQSSTIPSRVAGLGYRIESFSRVEGMFGTTFFLNSFPSSIRENALARLKNNLRSQTGNANVMAPIAESRELHGLITQATSFTYQFLQSLVELRKGRTRRAIRTMQDSWLAWNFGIAPMIHDIDDAGKAIASFINRQDSSYRIHGSAKDKGFFSFTPSNIITPYPPYGCEFVIEGKGSWELSYRFGGSFYSKVQSANDYNVFDHLGINLENIPQTLWELTAFSWMADYFGNIGTYLQDAFYCPPGSLVYLCETRKLTTVNEIFCTTRVIPGNPNTVNLDRAGFGYARVERVDFDRTVLATLPHVGLAFKTVDQVGANAIPKLLNLVSVLKVNPTRKFG